MANDALYKQVQDADKAFSEAGKKQYGNSWGDIRYQPDKQTMEVKSLGDEYKRLAQLYVIDLSTRSKIWSNKS